MDTTNVPIRTDSQGTTTLVVAVFFGCLTFVVISLRLVARVLVLRHVGPDDVLICIAACCTWGFMIMNILGVQHGIGDHIEAVLARGPHVIAIMYKDVWISSMFYNASLGFIKCSVLALYARLGDRQLRRMAHIVIGICAASATANVLVCIFQCWPLNAAWDNTITQKRCININAFYLANAGTNIATDLLAYLLPMRLVKNLQIPRKQKIAVAFMLCLGLFACVSSMIRISFIPVMLTSKDPTYVIAPPFYWSVIESNIGVLAASIPSFKPLAKRYIPRLIGESSLRRGYGNSGNMNPSHKSAGSNGFNKLESGDAVRLKAFNKDVSATTDSTAADSNYKSRNGDHKESAVSVTVSHGYPISSESRDSNSSEELFFKPGKTDIVRTTQFTTTVEDNPGAAGRKKEDFYPGSAV